MKPMVKNAHEPIWAGNIHLGDEPGIYGHAPYAGLCIELPVTITPFDATSPSLDVHFEVLAEEVKIHPPYSGHLVTILACSPSAGAHTWTRTVVGQGRLDSHRLELPISGTGFRHCIVRVEADPAVAPGLYDDFRLLALNLMSTTHYADFGFRYLS